MLHPWLLCHTDRWDGGLPVQGLQGPPPLHDKFSAGWTSSPFYETSGSWTHLICQNLIFLLCGFLLLARFLSTCLFATAGEGSANEKRVRDKQPGPGRG